VEVVLRGRLEELIRRGIPARCVFLETGDGMSLFEDLAQHIDVCKTEGDLQRAITAFGPDIISTIDTPTVVPVAHQFAPGAKLVYEVHTPYAANQKYLLDHGILAHVAGVIVPTQSQRELVEEHLVVPLPVKVVSNFLPESFLNTAESTEARHHRPIIMWVGRLDALKNWRAFTQISDCVSEKAEAEFWLVGAGMYAPTEEKEELERLISNGRLAGRFRWLPLVPHSEMARIYQCAARSGGCLVSTSWAESFGIAVLEAMALCCPVVVPDVIGLRDIVVDNESGLLYPAVNVDRASERVLDLVGDPERHAGMVTRARERARSFTLKRSVDELLSAFSEFGAATFPDKTRTDRFLHLTRQIQSMLLEQRDAELARARSKDEQSISELRQKNSQLEADVCGLEQQLGALKEQVASLEGQLEQQADLARSESQVFALERRVKQQAADIANRELHNRALEATITEKNMELARISNSRSWKVLARYWAGRRLLRKAASRLGLREDGDSLVNSSLYDEAARAIFEATGERETQNSLLLSILNRRPKTVIICFPIKEWDFRFQRPQHLLTQFAHDDHIVIYISTTFHQIDQQPRLSSLGQNVFGLQLPGPPELNLYRHQMDENLQAILLGALDDIRRRARLSEAICMVNLPFWTPLVRRARECYGWKIIYDCTGDHEAFSATRPDTFAQEEDLVRISDLVISSNHVLHERNLRLAARTLLLPNGEEDDRFLQLAENSWRKRYELLRTKIQHLYGKATIIVLSLNSLEYLRLCLEGIWQKTEYPNYDVIVVDNGSSSEIVEYLQRSMQKEPRLRVIFNGHNLGFTRGNNAGIRAARDSDYLILLNEDTVVTRGWLTRMAGYLNDPSIGLIGPVTNEVANEARIDVAYQDLSEMDEFAWQYTTTHDGNAFEIPTLSMYCVGLRKVLAKIVGLLDERYDIGMFADDDYSLRARQAGYRVVCAEDVFIHHWARSSVKRLKQGEHDRTIEENRTRFESKWGLPWTPPQPRSGREEPVSLLFGTTSGNSERPPVQNILHSRNGEIIERSRESRGTIIMLPSIGWNVTLFQRPHHLSRAFAELGYLVVFDCSNASDNVEGFKEIGHNFFLFRGDDRSLREIPNPILWSLPYNVDLKDNYPISARTVYDWIDDLEVFPFDRKSLNADHNRGLVESFLVTSVARRLHDAALTVRPDAIYLPNGVDEEHFLASEALPEDDPEMAEFLTRKKPLIGYYGALAEWFDYGLVERVAAMRPDWNFLLIGPDYDDSMRERGQDLLALPNVSWIGPRSYDTLPAYLNLFDVGMIPFVINEITLATSPLKLYEYFAGGKPVITTRMPECEAHSIVQIVNDAEEFAQALDVALERGKDPGYRARARQLGVDNSWRSRARTVAEILENG